MTSGQRESGQRITSSSIAFGLRPHRWQTTLVTRVSMHAGQERGLAIRDLSITLKWATQELCTHWASDKRRRRDFVAHSNCLRIGSSGLPMSQLESGVRRYCVSSRLARSNRRLLSTPESRKLHHNPSFGGPKPAPTRTRVERVQPLVTLDHCGITGGIERPSPWEGPSKRESESCRLCLLLPLARRSGYYQLFDAADPDSKPSIRPKPQSCWRPGSWLPGDGTDS